MMTAAGTIPGAIFLGGVAGLQAIAMPKEWEQLFYTTLEWLQRKVESLGKFFNSRRRRSRN